MYNVVMDYFTNQILPVVAADCAVFMDEGLLFIRRGEEPGKGRLTLPGGMMEIDETVEEACKREMLEETNLKVDGLKLVGVFSKPDRDPRGHRLPRPEECERSPRGETPRRSRGAACEVAAAHTQDSVERSGR